MATIVADNTEATGSDLARPLASQWVRHQSLPSRPDFGQDPVVATAFYFKALFSQEAQESLFAGRKPDKIYSVPRRFDLATLFVVSTAFALLFTVLGYFECSGWAKLGWCGYFSGVGTAQAALYQGRAPRVASVFAGGLLLPLFVIPLTRSPDVSGTFCLSFGMFVAGMPCGYFAGTLIGGVFLVADKLRKQLARRRGARVT